MLVSIITPAYNASSCIERMFASVYAQKYADWEWIIVDDCSSDGTPEKIENRAASDSRVRVLRLAKNIGPAGARNVALRQASGELVAFHDSDDVWHKDKLSSAVDIFRSSCPTLLCTNFEVFENDILKVKKGEVFKGGSFGYHDLLMKRLICCCSSVVCRTSAVRQHFFDQSIVTGAEHLLWLQMLSLGSGSQPRGVIQQEPLVRYHLSSSSVSSNKLRRAKYQFVIYRRLGLSMALTIALTINYVLSGIYNRSVRR